eukprot:12905240-Prorocentrum_lima.AAC.1
MAQLLGTEGVKVLERLESGVPEGGMVKSAIGDNQRPPDSEVGALIVSLMLNDPSGIEDRLEVSGSGGGGGGVLL